MERLCYDDVAEVKGLPDARTSQSDSEEIDDTLFPTFLFLPIYIQKEVFMKHIYQKLTAIAAAAITAVSALSATGLTASAYGAPKHLQNGDLYLNGTQQAAYNNLSSYAKNLFSHVWNSNSLQKAYPSYSLSDLNGRNIKETLPYNSFHGWGSSESVFCTLDFSAAPFNNLAQVKLSADKFFIRKRQSNDSLQPLASVLEYDAEAEKNHFAIRLLNEYNTNNLLSQIQLEDFTLDRETGKYSGKFVLYDYYIAGLKAICFDYLTKFEEPVIVLEDDEYIKTELSFSGKIPFKTDGTLYFGNKQSCTILKNLTFLNNAYYAGGAYASYYTRKFEQTYDRLYNNVYAGYLDGNTLHTAISGTPKNNFLNTKNFVCARTSGNNLYISIGEKNITIPEFQKAYGQQKLDIFLSYGWKDGFAHNTWVQNWLNSHPGTNARVYFYYNATSTYSGKYMCDITSDAFKNKLKQ